MTKPKMIQTQPGAVECHHDILGKYIFTVDSSQEGHPPEVIFTENETNFEVSFGAHATYVHTIHLTHVTLQFAEAVTV